MSSTPTTYKDYSNMNVFVFIVQLIAWFTLISLMHIVPHWILIVPLLFVFCMMMQGVFSFMHECFHNHAHRNKKINWFMGLISSSIFGTSYTLFEVNHHGHHVRNRTRPELVDLIYPDENPVKKISLYYIAIFGGIWIGGLVGSIICSLTPYRVKSFFERDPENNTYSQAFKEFGPKEWMRMRFETVFMILFWVVVFNLTGWRLDILLVAYACFAFSWSSLQWVYHVRTPVHTVEGAYNLRAPWPIRILFLNFNYNLSHHRDSAIPWQELYARSDQKETQPLWYRYLCIFLPPQPMPEDLNSIKKVYF